MLIYNITDKDRPSDLASGKTRKPKSIRVGSVIIPPGTFREVSNVPYREFARAIQNEEVAVNSVPVWYSRAKELDRVEARNKMKDDKDSTKSETDVSEPPARKTSKKSKKE
jgi:hypothetical protein